VSRSAADIRRAFLEFFAARGHTVVSSSALVPAHDPTLLFTNAGMVQFKDVFLGREERPYRRAASAQRCVRAGGKHNDLENVGYTARHHTFFEMLGNFSFGDYFKREAIAHAWALLTDEFAIPAERLWVTVHPDDDEAARIWTQEVGFPAARLRRIPGDDNFWSMGDTGPCGPCTEIFYDHGPEIPGGPPGSPDADGDRYVEIWNLVFMQYDRAADGTLAPLPRPSVDTGMGLERIAAVLQGVHDNYRTDLFRRLLAAAAELAGMRDLDQPSLKVIADHIRAAAFLIVDGVLPGNEGRGYVLRRIIRRACRHGHKLGIEAPFFHRMVAPLVAEMGPAYPELAGARARVEQALETEERRFAETLAQGLALLEEAAARQAGRVIPGTLAFRLYDTYGFPLDLTADWARERGLSVDNAGFEAAMARQRETARAAGRFHAQEQLRLGDVALAEVVGPHFIGYAHEEAEEEVQALFRGTEPVTALTAGENGAVILTRTPFYAESGGQVGDAGTLETPGGRFEVHDTRKQGELHVHLGRVTQGVLRAGEVVQARVDGQRRAALRRHHSATHLLNAGLRRVLGEHVAQRGSLVSPQRLRFDFSHDAPLSPEQRTAIEDFVNAQVLANHPAELRELPYHEAVAEGALAMAGEAYADTVRVLRLGPDSFELCGGTHVTRTGDIGLVHVVAESGVAAGVRRVEAVAGLAALEALREREALLDAAARAGRTSPDQLPRRLEQLEDERRRLERELERLRAQLASGKRADLAAGAVDIGAGTRCVAARMDGADAATLRAAVDRLKQELGSAVVVLASVTDGKVLLVAGVTVDRAEALPAGALVAHVAAPVGGRGGGRADFAQAGGNRPEALDAALAGVAEYARERLAGSAP
jgi:alanyl-tRNA synthetase